MKRLTAIILAVLLTAILSGCNQTDTPDVPPDISNTPDPSAARSAADSTRSGKTISVVCTIFPQYDWARQIIGDNADSFDLTLLLDSRIDLHSYQPSADDIIKISTCDLFIYVGGESDEWVYAVLKDAKNPDMIVIDLLDVLGDRAKMDISIEGMQGSDSHGHDHGHENEEEDEDEHVWLSLKNAEIFCTAITGALSSLDSDNAGEYKGNLAAYIEELSALDTEYRAVVSAASIKTLLFADRFPFRYLMDDYGLNYYAAFSGCSAETEASFSTIVFLANKVDDLGLHSVMVTESADQSIARTVISNTAGKNQQILVLDAIQSVTTNEARNGMTYISIMESNLNVLKEALK